VGGGGVLLRVGIGPVGYKVIRWEMNPELIVDDDDIDMDVDIGVNDDGDGDVDVDVDLDVDVDVDVDDVNGRGAGAVVGRFPACGEN